MEFAPKKKKKQSFADAARHAADIGSIPLQPRKSFLQRARWVLIPVGAAGVLAASGVAIHATRGSAAQLQAAAASSPEPATTSALGAVARVAPAGATPAKRASTPKKVAAVAAPQPEPASDSPAWREPVDLKPAAPAEAAPQPKPAPEPARPQAEPARPKIADQPVASPARLAEMERESKERRLALLAKRKAAREARAAAAAAAERREKARVAEAAAQERKEKARAAEAAQERREKVRSRAVVERARIARPVAEKMRSAPPPVAQPRVAEARPRSTGVRVGLLTPFGVIGLSGGSQRYSMYPGAPPPRVGGY